MPDTFGLDWAGLHQQLTSDLQGAGVLPQAAPHDPWGGASFGAPGDPWHNSGFGGGGDPWGNSTFGGGTAPFAFLGGITQRDPFSNLPQDLSRVGKPTTTPTRPVSSSAVPASGGAYGAHEQYRASIQKYAQANGIDPDALAAILQIEVPSGDPRATSPVGARGLGQIMPGTWAGLAEPGDDPYNADASIKNAAKYYGGLYRQFGDYGLAAAAYQGGPGAIVNGRARDYGGDGNVTPAGYAAAWEQHYRAIKTTAPGAGALPTGEAGAAIQTARQYAGLAYTNEGIRVTGNPADGFDCSSLTGYALGLRRDLWNAQAQADASQRITADQLQPGDLIFFQGTNAADPSARPVSHVGMYVGNGRFINAQNEGVREVDLSSPYWQAHLAGYGRVTPGLRFPGVTGGDTTGQR